MEIYKATDPIHHECITFSYKTQTRAQFPKKMKLSPSLFLPKTIQTPSRNWAILCKIKDTRGILVEKIKKWNKINYRMWRSDSFCIC